MTTVREVLYQHTKKVSSRNIAKAFKISRTTIRKYIQLARAHGYSTGVNDKELQEIAIKTEKSLYQTTNSSKATAMTSLLENKDLIKNWLSESNMTHTQVQRLLIAEGIVVSERSINRFIQKHFPELPKYTVHLLTEPGKEGQVDFGYVGMMKDKSGKSRKTYAFVMTLSHSRYRYVEFVFTQDQITWAQIHINAFQFFGGVPARIILDNFLCGATHS